MQLQEIMKELYSGNDNYSTECSYEYKIIMMKTMWYLEYVIITYEAWKQIYVYQNVSYMRGDILNQWELFNSRLINKYWNDWLITRKLKFKKKKTKTCPNCIINLHNNWFAVIKSVQVLKVKRKVGYKRNFYTERN